ncbi:MAG: S9 family peptidase [Chloroflexi bacterium]|nr:S9 family peptidase [Chloroflexota bacterium]
MEKRLVEPADLFRLKFITEAQLSPDGERVAYTVTHVDPDKEKEFAAIWMLTLATGESRQFTSGTARDSSPRWSPDGKQIAFLSSRGEKPQIYVIPVNGGESRSLTSVKQGVAGAPVWSPDGTQIAFTSLSAEEPRDPSKPFRVSRHVFRFDGMGILDDAVQSLYVIDVNGADKPRRLTDDKLMNTNPQWSPDGKHILFMASMLPDTHQAYFGRLKLITLESGEVRSISEAWGMVNTACWHPDGQRIVLTGTPHGLPIGSKSDMWVLNLADGTPICRTAGLKVGVDGGLQVDMPVVGRSPLLSVTPDGQWGYASVQFGGTVNLYKIALEGAESHVPLVTGERYVMFQNARAGRLLYLISDFNHPIDLYIANADGSNERQITCINDEWINSVRQPHVEHLLFPGVDGTQVEGWILLPPEGQAPYPTLLNIHGGPHSAFGHTFHFDSQMLCGAGYAVLMVNHRASLGYGNEFSTAIKGDWGNLDYNDLMSGVDVAIEKGYADGDRLGVFGISGGGNLSCWIVANTRRFKAAVPENPVVNWVSMYGVSDISAWFAIEELGGAPHEIPDVYAKCSPITTAHTCTTPTLLVQGEQDWRCPAEQSEQFYTTLKANGCIVEMLRLPNSSHVGSIMGEPVMRRAQNEALLEWMNRYVLGKVEEET